MVALHYENVAEGLSQILMEEWIRGDSVEARTLRRLMALYRGGVGFSVAEIDTSFEKNDEKNLIYRLSSEEKSTIENPVKYANECIRKIYKNFYAERLEALNRRLAESESSESGDTMEILKRISELRRESKTPPARIEEDA